ncbi:MAG: OmpW family protein [Alphaproteobacteria bacterium]|jgi:outer membrane protein|nr:OmpW family protein [Alphaproteobacteria bacterium]
MKKTLTAIALCAFCSFHAQAAVAEFDPHNWQVRLRAIDVSPQESSSGTIAGEATAGNAVMPELDISYFFNDNISLELILATSKHEIGWTPGALNLGDVWVLPPTLTAQYHFLADQQLSPYVGAGINYTVFYNSDPGTFNSVEYKNGFGYALQLGADYKLDQHWLLNADVKKIFLDTEVSVNNGAVRADVDLDPWVFGVGVGYRF